MRHEREIALETVDRHFVGVHLCGDRSAVANLVRIVLIEDQKPVARRGRVRQIMTGEVRRLQMRKLAGEDLLCGERAQMMFAELDATAIHAIEQLLDFDVRQDASAIEWIDDDLSERA